jgi:Vacuolar protein sorting-associated protein 35
LRANLSPDLHTQLTTTNLAALLVAPINSYQSVLTLLAIPNYVPLLTKQLFSTRRSIAHSIVSSVLKNETIIESPEDVNGVLELCHVLIKDQTDSGAPPAPNGQQQVNSRDGRRQGPYFIEREEMAEEQGWVARMVHLFRAESLDVQFEVGLLVFELYINMLNFIHRFLFIYEALANCTETFRPWWRTHAVHFPCVDNIINKTMSAV